MKPADLITLLQEFYADKLGLRLRHEQHARLVSSYEFNNTYQYIINREETQSVWVRDAIIDLGGQVPTVKPSSEPANAKPSEAAMRGVIQDDLKQAIAFVERWRPRVESISNDRQRKMLEVILGETLEQKRFFDQALAGRRDLLGRRPASAGTGDGVLPERWIE